MDEYHEKLERTVEKFRAVYRVLKVQNPVGLSQAFLYFFTTLCGLITAIPVGITLRAFHGRCILYAQVVWDNKWIYPWMETSCDYVLYSAIGLNVVYAFSMGCTTLIIVLPLTIRSKKRVGKIQAMNAKYLMKGLINVFGCINIVVVALSLAQAILVTVGFADFCRDIEEKLNLSTCFNAQKYDKWDEINIDGGSTDGVNGKSFHVCLTIAMIGAWGAFICWFLQMVISWSNCCRGCSCAKAEEKQKFNKSYSVALQRSRIQSPIGTPGGFMTPRSYGNPSRAPSAPSLYHSQQTVYAHMGPAPYVSIGPQSQASKA